MFLITFKAVHTTIKVASLIMAFIVLFVLLASLLLREDFIFTHTALLYLIERINISLFIKEKKMPGCAGRTKVNYVLPSFLDLFLKLLIFF